MGEKLKRQNIETLNTLSGRIFNSKRCLILVLGLISIYVILLSAVCAKKYFSFQYHDWDLAIYANVLWNIIHGKLWSSLFCENFLHEHASLIAFIIAVPYFIFRHPVTLLILQSLALGISAFPVYLVAKEKLGGLSGVIVTLLYLNYPPIYYASLYEFYFEAFSVPFLAFAFYFLLKNKKIPFLLMLIGACSCKENIPLTVAALGLFGLSRPKRRLLALSAVMLGAVWFYIDIKLMSGYSVQRSASFGSGLKYIGTFSGYGNNLQEIFVYLASHPIQILKTIFFDPWRSKLIYDTVGILLFIPIIRPDILLINAPHIMARLLSINPNEYTVYYHSAAPLAPFVFFAFIFSIRSSIKMIPKIALYRNFLLVTVLIFETICGILIWKDRPALVYFRLKNDPIYEEFIKQVPSQAFVASSFRFLSHLANRGNIRSIHTLFGTFVFKDKTVPPGLEYVLIDADDGVLRAMFFEKKGLFDRNLLTYLEKNNFGLVKARKEIVLFKKGHVAEEALVKVVNEPSLLNIKPSAEIGDNLALLKYDYKILPEHNGVLQYTFYWHVKNQIDADYALRFYITHEGKKIPYGSHILGYALFTPSIWKKGDIVKENYWLVLPDFFSGKDSISQDFIDLKNNKKVVVKGSP